MYQKEWIIMRNITIYEILEIDKNEITNIMAKLLLGDMNMALNELINSLECYGSKNIFNKKLGEVYAYTSCLHTLEIIDEKQSEKVYHFLYKIDK